MNPISKIKRKPAPIKLSISSLVVAACRLAVAGCIFVVAGCMASGCHSTVPLESDGGNDDSIDAGIACSWERQSPEVTSRTLTSVWGSSAKNIYAVGPAEALHFNGKTWQQIALPIEMSPQEVWGTSADNIYIWGTDIDNQAVMVQFNGNSWTEMALPEIGEQFGIVSIWATHFQNVYLNTSNGLFHFDGQIWIELFGPSCSNWMSGDLIWGWGDTNVYYACQNKLHHFDGNSWKILIETSLNSEIKQVSGTGPSDIYLVVSVTIPTDPTEDTSIASSYAKVVHFNGSHWTRITSETDTVLDSYWGEIRVISKNNIYALKMNGWFKPWHYNGIEWKRVDNYPEQSSPADLWGMGEKMVVAVGEGSGIYWFDGAHWKAHNGPPIGTIRSLWGSDANNVYALDWQQVLHGKNGHWHILPLPKEHYTSIWGTGPTDIFVGSNKSIFHYDGQTWQQHLINHPNDLAKQHYVTSVWKSKPRLDLPSKLYGLVHPLGVAMFDGSGWKAMASQPEGNVLAAYLGSGGATNKISGNDSDDFYVWVGAQIYHYNGVEWNTIAWPLLNSIEDLQVNEDGTIYVLSGGGAIYERRGDDWHIIRDGELYSYQRMLVPKADELVAVGHLWNAQGAYPQPVVSYFDGEQWRDVISELAFGTNDIWFLGPEEIVAAGSLGVSPQNIEPAIMKFNGVSWTKMDMPSDVVPGELWGDASDNMYAVSNKRGTILQFDGTSWTLKTLPANDYFRLIAGYSTQGIAAFADNGTTVAKGQSGWRVLNKGTFCRGVWSLWGDKKGTVFAGCYGGTVLRNQNGVWQEFAALDERQLIKQLWGTSANNLYLLGMSGALFHFNGKKVEQVKLAKYLEGAAQKAQNRLSSVYIELIGGSGPRDVHLFDRYKNHWHFNGLDWAFSENPLGLEQPDWFDVTGIQAFGRNDLYFTCSQLSGMMTNMPFEDENVLWHFNGQTWTRVYSDPHTSFYSLWGDNARELFLGGPNGHIVRSRCE